jgi:hypothetical protein
MNSFELKLDSTTYTCSGNHSTREHQNWNITAEMSGMRVSITIPIESKLTRLQAMAFIERLHVALKQAKNEQKPTVEYMS